MPKTIPADPQASTQPQPDPASPASAPDTERQPNRLARWARSRPGRTILALLAVAAVMVSSSLLTRWVFADTPAEPVPFSQILSEVEQGKVVSADLDEQAQQVYVQLEDESRQVSFYPRAAGEALANDLAAAGVEVNVGPPPSPSLLSNLFISLLPVFLILGLLLFLLRGKMPFGGLGDKQKAAPIPDTTLGDVAGMPEVVEELQDAVDLLRGSDTITGAGGRPPRGFLLQGPPGTGKTLLARAVAGEAKVPFFALSGSDFVEMFAGVGASRVRSVFSAARKAGKSVIFIDEIDAIGRSRSMSVTPGDSERESTLNALLVEMDGFSSREHVVVIAATNRADLLDDALTRPGRFDRTVTVPLPDRTARAQILRLHARDKDLVGIDLEGLARRTVGMSGADLENLVNQAALTAGRAARTSITAADMEEALATVVMGRARTGVTVTDRDREITAWHEAGHAVAASVIADAPSPVHVTIVPRGPAGGVTWMDGFDDVFFTRSQAKARLQVALAGRAAEEMLLEGDYTQGGHGDFDAATGLATAMVAQYGMSSLGVAVRNVEHPTQAPLVAGEVDALLDEALVKVRALLAEHRAAVEAVAARLLVDESIDGATVAELIEFPADRSGVKRQAADVST